MSVAQIGEQEMLIDVGSAREESVSDQDSLICFHVGYHKTGSTLLQRKVFPAHPDVSVVPMEESQSILLDQREFDYDRNATKEWIRRQRRQHGTALLVVSDEEFSGNVHTGGNGGFLPAVIADRLQDAAPDAHILIVVRRQDHMLDSVYRQYVKRGGTRSIDAYLFDRGKRKRHRFPGFDFDHFCYDKMISRYQELFGREKVHVLAYEHLAYDSDAFLKDLFTRFGLEERCGAALASASSRSNRGLGPGATSIMRVLNLFSREDPIDERAIVHLGKLRWVMANGLLGVDRAVSQAKERVGLTTRASVLSRRAESFIAEYYRDSNARLAELTGLDVRRWGYAL
ncbi:MAG: hypothetical protein GXP55_22795 [Deltaproteobacteria bacterium]|nr:hypothetical protein [Deltaproteobacteria bacterium]